jgi:uroporphyrin-III C-methyltransferase/precorrin-2 dehydrogenase/sirohydrochlorin ferrochelatase
MRGEVQRRLPDVLARRRFWEDVFEGEIAEAVLRGDDAAAQALLRAKLAAEGGEAKPSLGEVYLIGAGPNDADLLSFRGLRLLQRCDLVLVAPGLSAAIAELSRRDATRVSLLCWPPEISDVVPRLAAAVDAGQRACVLAPHDPFRAQEGQALREALSAAGIAHSVVPGIA